MNLEDNPLFSSKVLEAPLSAAVPVVAPGMLRLGVLPPGISFSLQQEQQQQQQQQQAAGHDGTSPLPLPLPPSPPGAAAGLAGELAALPATMPASSAYPEEYEFAEVLGAAMRGELDPAEAVREYAAICHARASAAREAAAGALQRATRHVALREAAEELEGEAATWHLLWYLHGNPAR